MAKKPPAEPPRAKPLPARPAPPCAPRRRPRPRRRPLRDLRRHHAVPYIIYIYIAGLSLISVLSEPWEGKPARSLHLYTRHCIRREGFSETFAGAVRVALHTAHIHREGAQMHGVHIHTEREHICTGRVHIHTERVHICTEPSGFSAEKLVHMRTVLAAFSPRHSSAPPGPP